MKAAAMVVLVALGLLAVLSLRTSHGHRDENLQVIVRVVDSATGEPLADAVVGTARWQDRIGNQQFEGLLSDALARDKERLQAPLAAPICATRTTGRAETVVDSAVYVSFFRRGPIQANRTAKLPEALFIDHPKYGRTILPIDPDAALAARGHADSWRLDLGTIRVP